MYNKTFVQLVSEGVLTDPENDIKEIIDYWEDRKDRDSLPDLPVYLGMSPSLYQLYLTNPLLCYQTIISYGSLNNAK